MKEGHSLHARLARSSCYGRNDSGDNLARTFSKMMFQDITNAAIKLLTQHARGEFLRAEDSIDLGGQGVKSMLDILHSKHPCASPATPTELVMEDVDPPSVHPIVFDCITARSIRTAVLRTKGAAGPSGLDAYCWRRLCTTFSVASNNLRHSLALFGKRLCTTLVDPKGISPLLACRLIVLDKCPGVRPTCIGIRETQRRIIAKAVLLATKGDLQEAVGPKQLGADQIAGIGAAIHAV